MKKKLKEVSKRLLKEEKNERKFRADPSDGLRPIKTYRQDFSYE